MIKIIHIKEDMPGGTENYCLGLRDILSNEPELCIEVPKIPQVNSSYLHYSYQEEILSPFIEQADIVHINGYTAQGTIDALKLAHKMGKKIVYTAHWHPFQCLAHPFLGKMFFNLKMKELIRKYADVVTTINNEDTEFFKKFHTNVIRIPHWQRKSFSTGSNDIARNPRMILFVGRLDNHVKNFHQLLALEQGRYEIHCVGKGETPVNRKDIILHQGISDEELCLLYHKASLLVAPSKYEAFSFAALEALSAGTPVVMSERVRIADYLDGICGYSIYRYGDSADFVQKVSETIGKTVDTNEIDRRFNPNEIAQKYKKLYMSLIQQ